MSWSRQNGFTLIEILLGAGAFALLALLFASYALYLTKFQTDQAMRRAAEEILYQTHRLVYDTTAWSNTVNDTDNINLACLRDTGSTDESSNTGCRLGANPANTALSLTANTNQAFFLRNANINAAGGLGDLFYDPYNLKGLSAGTPGFTADGQRCDTYSTVSPTDRCPIFMRLNWSAQCNTTRGCKYPLIRIGAFMEFSASSGSQKWVFGQPRHRLVMFRNPAATARRPSVVYRENRASGTVPGPCRPASGTLKSRNFYSRIDMGTALGTGGTGGATFRLDAARYECEFSSAAFGVGTHYAMLTSDLTHPVVVAPEIMGSLERAGTTGWASNSFSLGYGELNVTNGATNYYLALYCQQENTITAYVPAGQISQGRPASTGEDEVYATVRCTRLD